jgi:hypothetical protein
MFIIEDCVPILQHAIKDAVTTEMKEWLFRYDYRATQGKLETLVALF